MGLNNRENKSFGETPLWRGLKGSPKSFECKEKHYVVYYLIIVKESTWKSIQMYRFLCRQDKLIIEINRCEPIIPVRKGMLMYRYLTELCITYNKLSTQSVPLLNIYHALPLDYYWHPQILSKGSTTGDDQLHFIFLHL